MKKGYVQPKLDFVELNLDVLNTSTQISYDESQGEDVVFPTLGWWA